MHFHFHIRDVHIYADKQPSTANQSSTAIKSTLKRKKSTDSDQYSISGIDLMNDKSGYGHHDQIGGGCSSSVAGDDSGGEDSQEARRKKKARTTFTGRQIFELEKQFEIKKYLSSSERGEMAKLLNVTETQVSNKMYIKFKSKIYIYL